MNLKPLALVGILGLTCAASGQKQVLERYDQHDWTLKFTIDVSVYSTTDPHTKLPESDVFKFDTAAVVFPLITGTTSSRTDDSGIKGELRLNDRPGDASPTMLTGYHSGTRLGKWTLQDWTGREVGLIVTIPASCFSTRFDEAAAGAIGWPAGPWPAEARSTFEPQFYVDHGPDGAYDMSGIKEWVKKLCNGKDPKSIKPTALAKWLAGSVMERIQPSGNGLIYNRTGQLEGIDLQGAASTLDHGRGSEFDIVCLLAAVYREVGLPARTVIGVDTGKIEDEKKLFKRRGFNEELRAWVEFALYDEAAGGVIWVPVDVVRMRKSSSRMGALDKPWKFFGSNDELSSVFPFAFQFHPPTTVRAYGSPGFWGWMVTPVPPDRAVQALTYQVQTTPKTGAPPQPQTTDPKRRY